MTPQVIICDGGPKRYVRTVGFCPVEKRRRRFTGFDQTWYGVTWHCCGCGDSWSDGEMHERPFKRGWRKEAIEHAREMWSKAMPLSAYGRWLRAHPQAMSE